MARGWHRLAQFRSFGAGCGRRTHAVEGQRGDVARGAEAHPRQRGEEPERPDRALRAVLRIGAGPLLLAQRRRGHAGMTIDLERNAPKPPPENPEAEASLLGAVLIDHSLYGPFVRGRISPSDLSRDNHKLVLGAME